MIVTTLFCRGTVDAARRFLDGRTADGSVGLGDQSGNFSGTNWIALTTNVAPFTITDTKGLNTGVAEGVALAYEIQTTATARNPRSVDLLTI